MSTCTFCWSLNAFTFFNAHVYIFELEFLFAGVRPGPCIASANCKHLCVRVGIRWNDSFAQGVVNETRCIWTSPWRSRVQRASRVRTATTFDKDAWETACYQFTGILSQVSSNLLHRAPSGTYILQLPSMNLCFCHHNHLGSVHTIWK